MSLRTGRKLSKVRSMNPLLEPIFKSPQLPDLVTELQEAWAAEQDRRRQFLNEITPSMKAEFIEGEFVMHSPARARHLSSVGNIYSSLWGFTKDRLLGQTFVEKCLVSLTRNDFEPDVVWFSEEKASEFDDDQMRFPAPDFVVEVLSESTEKNDRGVKFTDYALHGVQEYWIVDPKKKTVEQYVLEGGQKEFTLFEKLSHGTVISQVIEGFEIALDDIFK